MASTQPITKPASRTLPFSLIDCGKPEGVRKDLRGKIGFAP